MAHSEQKINSKDSNRSRFLVKIIFILICTFLSYGFETSPFHNPRKLRYPLKLQSIQALKTWRQRRRMNVDPVDDNIKSLSHIPNLVYGCDDLLFGHIEKMELQSPRRGDFGSFLDAGTGSHSLRWIASILHRTHKLDIGNAKAKLSLPVSMAHYTAGEKYIRYTTIVFSHRFLIMHLNHIFTYEINKQSQPIQPCRKM